MRFPVPLVPTGVNHYVRHFRNGGHRVTDAALAYKEAVAVYARGEFVKAKRFTVSIHIVLGYKERGDIDGFPKLVLDGMADAGIFRNPKGERLSDAYVDRLVVTRDCKTRPERGWTVIEVEPL